MRKKMNGLITNKNIEYKEGKEKGIGKMQLK